MALLTRAAGSHIMNKVKNRGESMKKAIILISIISIVSFSAMPGYAQYKKFDIKYGMHERVVNKEYGNPMQTKTIKAHPIPIKKGLYKIDETGYAILYFFSGRIYKIVLLNDLSLDEAMAIFNEE